MTLDSSSLAIESSYSLDLLCVFLSQICVNWVILVKF